jgi:uncharacterized protein YbjT (DUF2867 family)
VILFGATGMVGQAVLRECMLDPGVDQVLAVGRRDAHLADRYPGQGKLRELVRSDLFDLEPVRDELTGYDACLFCLGVSSVGMKEPEYRRITQDLTLSVAGTLAAVNPDLRFAYVSGTGTDGSEQGRSMWARVKGHTENALLAMPFHAYMLRPGFIRPMHGVVSRTRLYALLYKVIAGLYPVLRLVARNSVITSEEIGRAMVKIARNGADTRILESPDIAAMGR